jgi:alpha/beta hydrolase family protein
VDSTLFRVFVVSWLIGLSGPAARAQSSCDNLLLAARTVRGQKVGPSSCVMQEADVTYQGRPIHRVDIGLDGTVDGFLARTGDYKEYFSNSPDLVFPQTWGPRPIVFAVAAYQRDKGAAMTIVYPADRAAWNRKTFVMVHGRGVSFKDGSLKPWNRNLDPARPLADLDKYDRLLLAKGYAVVKTRRTTTENRGEITATLEDGSTVDYIAFNDTARYVMDFAEVAQRLLSGRVGDSTRTYFYGHSAGARIGRALNYTPGLNAARDGKPFFDGFLNDDPAAGTWYPVVMKDGRDVLFATEADKARFAPQIDVAHQMYNNIWPPHHPDWMSSSYLENKRNNAKILRDKGLGAKYRMYEVRSISHSGGENQVETTSGAERDSAGSVVPVGSRVQNLDLSKMMDRFVDLLDAWVEHGAAPPPTRSDWPELGDADRDGIVEHPALAFPEVACPLGVYYSYPESTSGTTAFAAFTGRGLEPLDAKKVFVDMNRDGVWDYRETPTEAWRRVGLLQKSETLTREKYVACVQHAAEQLRGDGFFSEATAAGYVERAKTADLQLFVDKN